MFEVSCITLKENNEGWKRSMMAGMCLPGLIAKNPVCAHGTTNTKQQHGLFLAGAAENIKDNLN